MTTLCFASIFLLICSYILYPVFLALIGKFFNRSEQQKSDDYIPIVTLVIAAYNEEDVIEEKIINSMSLNYPSDRLEIIVLSDASTDKTDDIVRSYSENRVKLLRVEGRNGKTFCQNAAAAQASGEIIVFSDANAMYNTDSILNLVKNFRNTEVGVVIGKRTYASIEGNSNQEGLYEKLEVLIKKGETILGGTIGANGAIYALRKDLYIPLAKDRISDIIEPLNIAITHKKIIVQEDNAISVERHVNSFSKEFRRKRRIVLRTMSSLWKEKWLLIRSPGIVIKLLLHKVIRWMTIPLLGVIAITGLLSPVLFCRMSALCVMLYLFFGTVLQIYAGRKKGDVKFHKIINIVLYSFVMFSSSFLAFVDFLQGKNRIVWETRQ